MCPLAAPRTEPPAAFVHLLRCFPNGSDWKGVYSELYRIGYSAVEAEELVAVGLAKGFIERCGDLSGPERFDFVRSRLPAVLSCYPVSAFAR